MATSGMESLPQYTNVSFYLFPPCYNLFMPKSAPRALHKKAPRRQARGLRTREAILARAVDIASVQGSKD